MLFRLIKAIKSIDSKCDTNLKKSRIILKTKPLNSILLTYKSKFHPPCRPPDDLTIKFPNLCLPSYGVCLTGNILLYESSYNKIRE